MNCRQAEDLLPLYVSDDLAPKQARSLTEHLQSCTACTVVLTEHHQAQELLRELTPQTFSAADFDAVRRNVWRRIEAESTRPVLVEVIAGFFSPRIAWAAALLIALMIGGIFFLRSRHVERPAVAFQPPRIEPTPVQSPSVPADDKPRDRQAYSPKRTRRGITNRPKLRSEEPASIAAIGLPPVPVRSSEPGRSGIQDSRKLTRMEIQTRDPNIRIIWLAQ